MNQIEQDRIELKEFFEKTAKKISQGYEPDKFVFQCSLRDILTDLRQISTEFGLDFDKAIKGSKEVYNEEIMMNL
jgi:hypothetical protein